MKSFIFILILFSFHLSIARVPGVKNSTISSAARTWLQTAENPHNDKEVDTLKVIRGEGQTIFVRVKYTNIDTELEYAVSIDEKNNLDFAFMGVPPLNP